MSRQEWLWARIWEEKVGQTPTAAAGQRKMRKTLQRNQSLRQSNSGGRKGEETKGLSNKWSSTEGRAGENKDEEAYTGESGQGTQGLDIQQRMTKENK